MNIRSHFRHKVFMLDDGGDLLEHLGGTECSDVARSNWPPFRPDTRHNLEGLRLSSSTGLCLTTTNVSN